ncbi:glycosyl transferase-like sugar-binding protein [Aquabacterium commune]|uniref:Glycosyl transferase-like sugar-binding protein n=1 Tax=Aquabacterium commune TaxID=70586 RepID=A0A4R6RQW4_9BURK|nr:glycosyltransferase [Aquabacterium commune]TDP88286.1 glycosyl transferase-like sugar-binding protein [Aquabacterium commune]
MTHPLLQAALRELDAVHRPDAAIPPCVHMTARSKHLDEALADNLARIRQHNPGWSLTLYDDQDIEAFLQAHYGPAVLAIYQQLNPRYGAARADLFRYLCIYRLGGVYLDIKSGTTMPLAQWLRPEDRFILSQWDNGPTGRYSDWGLHRPIRHIPGGEYQQWFLVASAGHPYLRAVCGRVLRNIVSHRAVPAKYGRMGVLEVTGPIAFSLAIHPILRRHPHRFVDVEREGGLCYSCHPGQGDHIARDPGHYSRLQEPVVRLGAGAHRLFTLARDFDQQVQRWRRRLRR